jgi:hypothetical protein
VAKWDRGKLIEGKYYFYDDLEFKTKEWGYSTNKDRQFYTEVLQGLRPDGKTLITNDIDGPTKIPAGTYDVGDGYFDPIKRMICKYDGTFMRELGPGEEEWIHNKCRYCPNPIDDPAKMDGTDDEIIKEMIKLNTNPALRAARMKGQK